MTHHEDSVIVDACTLQNFSVVGRLDILEQHFADRAGWTQAIHVSRNCVRCPRIRPVMPRVARIFVGHGDFSLATALVLDGL